MRKPDNPDCHLFHHRIDDARRTLSNTVSTQLVNYVWGKLDIRYIQIVRGRSIRSYMEMTK